MIDIGYLFPRLRRMKPGDFVLPLFFSGFGGLSVGDRIAVYSSNGRIRRGVGTIAKISGTRILVDWDEAEGLISNIMKNFQQYFSQFKISTHALATLLVLLVTGDKYIPVFHHFWTTLFLMLPKMAQEGIESAVLLGLLYFASRKGMTLNQFTTGVDMGALQKQPAQVQKQQQASKQ